MINIFASSSKDKYPYFDLVSLHVQVLNAYGMQASLNDYTPTPCFQDNILITSKLLTWFA